MSGTEYQIWSGSGDHLSDAYIRHYTIAGAYHAAFTNSQSWEGYILVTRRFDGDARSQTSVVLFAQGQKLWEEQ
jgi:hypothetical protein